MRTARRSWTRSSTLPDEGVGKWTVIDSANLAQPVVLIAEAVFARCVSAMKDGTRQSRYAGNSWRSCPAPPQAKSHNCRGSRTSGTSLRSKIVSWRRALCSCGGGDRKRLNLNYGGIVLMCSGGDHPVLHSWQDHEVTDRNWFANPPRRLFAARSARRRRAGAMWCHWR